VKSLRIGCVKYLNARPLIRGWPGAVEFDHPSTLCKQLASGELDVALVSSFEFLRNPIYQIVDDVSISSDGPIYSVVVAHTGQLSKIEQIEIDPASETAANLLRSLIAELGLKWRFVRGVAESAPSTSPPDTTAQLLIGDQAIRFRQSCDGSLRFWDLGEEWQKFIGLPFVYALWLIRPEFTDAKTIAARLRVLRDQNLAKLDELIADENEFAHEFCSRYYREHLRFTFGQKEKQGLQAFAGLCAKHGLLPQRDLAFRVV
jgi:chorismate dehydratase